MCCTAVFGFFRLGEILLPSGCTYDSNIHLSDGGLALADASQVYCPESRVRLREEKTNMEM